MLLVVLPLGLSSEYLQCSNPAGFLLFNVEHAERLTNLKLLFQESSFLYYEKLIPGSSRDEVFSVIETGLKTLDEAGLGRLALKRMRVLLGYLDERNEWEPIKLQTFLFEPFHVLISLLRFAPSCEEKTKATNQQFCQHFFKETLMIVKHLVRQQLETSSTASAAGFYLFVWSLGDFGLSLGERIALTEKNYLVRHVHAEASEERIRYWIPAKDERMVHPSLVIENAIMDGRDKGRYEDKIQKFIKYVDEVWADPLSPFYGRSVFNQIVGTAA